MEIKKSTRGGKREGAGRPKTGKIWVPLTISLEEHQKAFIVKESKKRGLSISRYISEVMDFNNIMKEE